MLLLFEPLETTLTQQVEATADAQVHAIRPHLYIKNNPAGSLRVNILDSNNRLIESSDTIAISAITSALYFHGYVRFLIEEPLKKGEIYHIRLVGTSGYSFTDTSSPLVGWCFDFDLAKYPKAAGVDSAFDLEIWHHRQIKKGME